ncbi:hypothetical protein C0Q70_12772 [Pomacea canaliculata]|uniref:Uncharacterized protein n=1 Tax=Pomacea canaliculata TaxID=400727 RepID=A0A2T7P2H1_POMCA|nr:hypothetical protein C0Q70_12772 [Pomacea canaliculata]
MLAEDNEEFMDVHVTLLAEQASVHRQILLRIFQACTPVVSMRSLQPTTLFPTPNPSSDRGCSAFTSFSRQYENWMSENEAKIPEAEAKRRREQLALYRQVLDLYGGDTEWTSLTPQQRVSRDEAGPRGIAEGQALWPASRYGHRCIERHGEDLGNLNALDDSYKHYQGAQGMGRLEDWLGGCVDLLLLSCDSERERRLDILSDTTFIDSCPLSSILFLFTPTLMTMYFVPVPSPNCAVYEPSIGGVRL